MPLISTNDNLTTIDGIRHFTWDDIVKFSKIDRYMISYRQDGSGDWKSVPEGGDGFLLTEINGIPYWSDAIGQIPFAIDYFTDRLLTHGEKDRAISETVEKGIEYGDGTLFGTPDFSNTYDNYFILRGALWAAKNYDYISQKTARGNKNRLIDKGLNSDLLEKHVTRD